MTRQRVAVGVVFITLALVAAALISVVEMVHSGRDTAISTVTDHVAWPSGFTRTAEADGCRESRTTLCFRAEINPSDASKAVAAALRIDPQTASVTNGLPGAAKNLHLEGAIDGTRLSILVSSHKTQESSGATQARYAGSTVTVAVLS